MKIADEQKEYLENIYQKFLNDEKVLRMKEIPMHRGSNCYIHSFKVARLAIKRALRHKKADLEIILIASIFHDYYLYDWRKEKRYKKGHGKQHPYIAAYNAERDFGISKEEQDVIESHMWPTNIKRFPKTKEARIVSFADKTIATKEFLCSKKFKVKRQDKYLNEISHLFK